MEREHKSQRDTLLIVDDMEINRIILRGMFEDEYNIMEAENGERALLLLQHYHTQIAAMLLDLVMPIKDGYQVMEEMGCADLFSQVPVIVITSEDSAESEVRSFDLGASDIIMKPFEPHVVKRRVRNVVELYRHKLHLEELVQEQSQSLRESNSIMIDALSAVIEYRSLESGQHIRRIRYFTKILLENVAKSYQEYNLDARKVTIITDASSLHDIGKIAIPDSILNKPGRLTPEEFEVMKTHTVQGCGILSGLDRMQDKEYLSYAYNICRYHHERWDGRGYPDGLKGDAIPICAQVVAIADCYDALTTDRVYKKAIPQEQAFNMILNGECGSFSPRLLECFKNVRDAFADLSRQYADGAAAPSTAPAPALPAVLSGEGNTLEQGQRNFFAMMRYADSTIMEVDVTTGTYHLLYLADPSFAPLRTGASFGDSIRTFAQESVHPDDRELVLQLLGSHMKDFFEEGLMKRERKYRVLDQDTGVYRWCRATLLRIDIQNPRQRKVLLIWKRIDQPLCGAADEAAGFGRDPLYNRLMDGACQSLNDRWFTLTYVNTGLTNLVGYTREELAEKFHNRYLELVYPPDRELLWDKVQKQMRHGKTFEGEYRLMCKDGRIKWVLDRCVLATGEDGREYFYSIFVDITASKSAQEELRLSLERHQIILDQTNDIIFEWNIATDSLIFSNNWEEKYGYTPITQRASVLLPTASHIHPDDARTMEELIAAVRAGIPYKEVQFRMAKADGRYIWCRIRATTQFDQNHKPFKAVGIIADIDNEKRATQRLVDRAERDNLTNLYNKEAARKRIQWRMRQDGTETAAMFIIDLDNFKSVNDRFGHMFGDAVLTEMASSIAHLFRDGDIVARIGGDEFLAYMSALPSPRIAKTRAEKIIQTISSMMRENLKDTPLTCSVGVAYYPTSGEDYITLFQRCDHALYLAKAAGKNRYEIYGEQTQMPALLQRSAPARTHIDSEETSGLDSLVVHALEQLYNGGDFDRAVNAVLEMIGRTFNVSRAYVFESTPDGEHADNTYEWCSEGISPAKDMLQNYAYMDGDVDYRANFSENGVFYCPNVKTLPPSQCALLEVQGVLALLQCAILDGGKFCGFVGFDDCAIHRLWTKEQINALCFVSRVLSVFLMKKRMQDRLAAVMPESKEEPGYFAP